ncbi:unnamed protein product [Discula destructiva]
MASTTSSVFPLSTEAPCTTDCGDSVGTANSAGTVSGDAGASGSSSNSFALSTGGMIAIIIVVAVVAIGGSRLHLLLCQPEPMLIEGQSSSRHFSMSQRKGNGRYARPFGSPPERSSLP